MMKTKSHIAHVKMEPQHSSELQVMVPTSSRHNAKPRVGCRFYLSHRLSVALPIWIYKVVGLSLGKELFLRILLVQTAQLLLVPP